MLPITLGLVETLIIKSAPFRGFSIRHKSPLPSHCVDPSSFLFLPSPWGKYVYQYKYTVPRMCVQGLELCGKMFRHPPAISLTCSRSRSTSCMCLEEGRSVMEDLQIPYMHSNVLGRSYRLEPQRELYSGV